MRHAKSASPRRQRIWELHEDHMQNATVVEGGAANLRYNKDAKGSKYYPHRNLSVMLLNLFADKHQLSRAVIEGLLTMLRFKDEDGDKFNIEGLSGVHHEHFRARSRRYAPLLLQLKRKVKCSAIAQAAGETEAYVHEIPANLIIDRKLRSKSAVQEMMVNQGGKALTAVELDGMLGQDRPHADEIEGKIHQEDEVRFVRTWEEEEDIDKKDVECLVRSTDMSDLCEMYTPEEAAKLGGGECTEGQRSCGSKFVCMGFVRSKKPSSGAARRVKYPKRRKQRDDADGEYVVSREPWGKEGTPDDSRFSIRKKRFVHNSANDPYVAMPVIGMIDGFNSVGMHTKSTVGATYIGFGSTTPSLQRKRGQAHITTCASKGASCEGEMDLFCRLTGDLQKGCTAVVHFPATDGEPAYVVKVFLRGGLLVLVADSPQRALMCYCKHPNSFSRRGPVGDQLYDIVTNRRTRGLMLEERSKLEALASNPVRQGHLSSALGVVAPQEGDVWPLFEAMDIVPSRVTPVESLHADALALVQKYLIALQNTKRRELISATMRHRKGNNLYPPGAEPLKDPVTDYSSLTGSVRASMHTLLHFKEAILDHGEFAHQQHKRTNKSNCGRNASQHYITSANTNYAWAALADGVRYNVMNYDYRKRLNVEVTVRPGESCVRVLQTLRRDLPGGLSQGGTDVREPGNPSRQRVADAHQGSAIWDASLIQDSHDWMEVDGHGNGTPPKWEAMVASGRFRPTLPAMKAAYKVLLACRREPGDVSLRCAELRCPTCWNNTGNLDSSTIQCSRYNHFASMLASSGRGSWKGGDVRSAADYLNDDGPPDAWVLGEGGGQDVEVWRGTPPTGGDATASSSVENLSMGKIVYFFKHRGNAREGTAEPGPGTWWVLFLFE
ncbi:unnamed protein product [Ectocarpus sp. CCAP 1310/34]|nr:unnamed protein product [Ectocarpus sp. CCAP 1310/34]